MVSSLCTTVIPVDVRAFDTSETYFCAFCVNVSRESIVTVSDTVAEVSASFLISVSDAFIPSAAYFEVFSRLRHLR